MNVYRIVFFSTHAYPLCVGRKDGFGGAELEIWNLSRVIAGDPRFDVSLVTVTDEIVEPTVIEGVKVVPVKKGETLVPTMPRMERQVRLLGLVWRIFRQIYNLHPRLVFTMLASPHALAAYYAAKLRGAKYAFRIAGDSEISYEGLKRIFPRKGAKQFVKLLSKCSIVFTQSKHQKDELKKNFGVESHIVMNPHFIPEPGASFYSFKKRANALWVARAYPLKRPQLFLDLAEKMPKTPFRLIMPKVEAFPRFFDEMVARVPHIPNVEFIPGVCQDEIDRMYGEARVFVLTSETEGFSNVVIEAFKNGVPVVSLLHNPNNVLVPITEGIGSAPGFCADGDFDKMEQLVRRMFDDKMFWLECANKARRFAINHFSAPLIGEIYKQKFIRSIKGMD